MPVWQARGKSPGGSWDEQLETPNRPVTEVSWYEADGGHRELPGPS